MNSSLTEQNSSLVTVSSCVPIGCNLYFVANSSERCRVWWWFHLILTWKSFRVIPEEALASLTRRFPPEGSEGNGVPAGPPALDDGRPHIGMLSVMCHGMKKVKVLDTLICLLRLPPSKLIKGDSSPRSNTKGEAQTFP